MSRDPVLDFYGDLADDYHLIHADWDESLRSQGVALDRLIRAEIGPGPHRLLDCSCGIGTQALGLAALGHRVHATDISAPAVARAEREADARGLALTFGVADMCALAAQVEGVFDLVLSCDNALAHMLDDEALARAAAGMAAKVAPGGLLLASIRDYETLRVERPNAAPPSDYDAPGGRRAVFQLWDWEDDSDIYRMTIFILRQEGDDWTMRHSESRLRAVGRDAVGAALGDAGLTDIVWRLPPASGYYQPVVTARKPR